MGNKFEGYKECFSMTFKSNDSLLCLRNTNDSRILLDTKIAKGTATRLDIMTQLKAELQLFDVFLKDIEGKKKAKRCCAVVNIVVSNLTKRINNMWNTIFLLFTIDDEVEPTFMKVSNSIIMTSCTNCRSCDVTIESIMRNIEILSIQEDAIFNFSSSDFIKILQTTTFVDKTLMIKEVFCHEETKGIVITAPRKFGKSTNLTMLKYFLEIQVDSRGKPLTKAKVNEPVTDTSNYEVFKRLNISKESSIIDKHLGKYPILYANCHMENDIKSYDCVLNGCKEIIHKSFLLHNYLQKSSKLSIQQRKLCKLWCDDASYKNFKNIEDISSGLKLLCTFLTVHYDKKCFVLIDELDFFTQTVTITDTLLKDYKLIVLFLRQFLLFLKTDSLVVKAFATGKSGYAIQSIVPSCMEIQPFYCFHNFTDFYGLTDNELEYLFNKPEFKHVSTTIKEVKAYYGSYNKIDDFATTKQIYCIWSILNVLKCKRLDNYWRDFGNIFCNFSNPTIKDVMQKLLNDGFVMVVLYHKAAKTTRPTTPPIIAASGTPSKKSLDYFFNIMLDLGYLTCNSTSMMILDLHSDLGSCIGYVTIPNQEVGHDVENKISLLS